MRIKVMTGRFTVLLGSCLACVLAAGPAVAKAKDEAKAEAKAEAKREAKREDIDAMAKKALSEILSSSAGAKTMFADSAGHAVFDNWQTSLALAGGSGTGVAVDKDTGERTYMKMKTIGLKFGIGVQKCQVVFLFQTPERFKRFVTNGWEAEAGADAAIGTEGANAAAKWTNGLAVFQITEKGLMLSADISGTKYYPAKALN